jgi:hypothetical protein
MAVIGIFIQMVYFQPKHIIPDESVPNLQVIYIDFLVDF